MASLPLPERTKLAVEGRVLARHLLRTPVPEAVLSRYVEAHERGLLAGGRGLSPVDRMLVALAASGRLGTFVADGHAALFRRRGALRRKLVLLLALLETSAATHRETLGGTVISWPGAFLRLVGLSLRGVVAFGLGLLLWPARIVCLLLPAGGSRS